MHFNIFNKNDQDVSSIGGKLKPASVKSKFSLIGNNTPSLTDNSFRGEQKRALVLEEQLREVSLTASKAYDKVDELKLQNEMLDDQVQQQKQLIETFTKQLEQSKKDMLEFKRFHELELKQKLEQHSSKNAHISKLEHDKDMLMRENETLQSEIKRLKDMYNDEAKTLSLKIAENEKMAEVNQRDVKQPENPQAYQYREIILSLKQRITDLEESIEAKNESYENNLMSLKNAMHLLTRNQTLLKKNDHGGHSTTSVESIDENILDKGDGSTYVLENISFI